MLHSSDRSTRLQAIALGHLFPEWRAALLARLPNPNAWGRAGGWREAQTIAREYELVLRER